MKHRLLTTLALALATTATMADTVTESQARATASRFFASHAHASKAAAGSQLTLAAQSTGYYIYNRGQNGGFVVVAADDRATAPVLGYADEGTADPQNMPEGLKQLLSEYDRELAYAARHNATAATMKATETARTAIEPMITAHWYQNSPFNDSCPDYKGTVCLAGIVAPHMAQIMHYYKWPKQGTGEVSYDWYVGGEYYKTLSADLSKSVYDWEAMTDTYDSQSTDREKAAVATLIRDAGLATETVYTPSGSAAYPTLGVMGLVNHFGYDKAIAWVYREACSHAEWDNLLYGELAEGRPVYLCGYTNTQSAFAFIADGYREGYYHMNWGFAGLYDGYYLTSAIDYGHRGTTNSTSGASFELQAFVGIRPALEGSDYAVTVYAHRKFHAFSTTARRDSTMTFGSKFYYYGLAQRKLTLGLKVVAEDGTTTYVESQSKNVLYEPFSVANDLSNTHDFTVDMTGFPKGDGTYKLYPACLDEATGTWHEVRSLKSHGLDDHVVATATGDEITFSQSETVSTLTATQVAMTSRLYAGNKATGKAVFATKEGTEFLGDMRYGFVDKDGNSVTEKSTSHNNATLIDLGEGESSEIPFIVIAPDSAGDYGLVVYDANYNPISDTLNVTVLDPPTSELGMQITSSLSMPSTTNVQPNDIEVTAQVKCTGGLYTQTLYLQFYEGEEMLTDAFITAAVVMGEGESDNVVIKGSFATAKPSTTYKAKVFYWDKSGTKTDVPSSPGTDYNTITFTTAASTTAIADTQLPQDGQPACISVYSPSGKLLLRQRAAKADLSTLPAGIYIVKTATEVKKVAN